MKLLVTGGSGFIGTNLIDHFKVKDIEILNVDWKPPQKNEYQTLWVECDILNKAKLLSIFEKFNPSHVIHLAARVESHSRSLDVYRPNTEGTANVLEAIKATKSVLRTVITSTNFVYRPGSLPKHDEDFDPHTVYGQSKVITEQLTRKANLDCVWTIIRPTNTWGPWHPRYPYEFWYVLKQGYYLHPGRKPVMRSYGYVGNVVFQIEKILLASPDTVNGKVFYMGDMPIQLIDWTNGFSRALTGKDVRVVPRALLKALALVGDFTSSFGVKFPITSSRFRSMTEDYLAPMSQTINTFGASPYSLNDGIQETVQWLDDFWSAKSK